MATIASIGVLMLLAAQAGFAAAQPSSSNFFDNMFAQFQPPASSYFMPEASQLVLIFPLAPLEQSPTPPLGYTSLQMKRWDWVGGAGFLVLTRNDFGEHGKLTELMYFPGLYQPQCVENSTAADKVEAVPDTATSAGLSSTTQESSSAEDAGSDANKTDSDSRNDRGAGLLSYSRDSTVEDSSDGIFSAQRFWVDMQVSQAVGRAYFGYPKEPATFQWTQNSVTAKDGSGTVFFSATFGNPSNDTDALPSWFPAIANGKLATIQWPINDALTRLLARVINDHTPVIDAAIDKLPIDVQRMLRAGAAAAQRRALAERTKVGIKFIPNTQTLSFPGYSQLAATKISKVFFNGLEFTGRLGRSVGLADDTAGVITGTPGALSEPQPYSCY